MTNSAGGENAARLLGIIPLSIAAFISPLRQFFDLKRIVKTVLMLYSTRD